MKTLTSCLVALAASASCFAQTTIPAIPSLTAGAEIKALRFDWEPVADASWYEFEYKPHKNAQFAQHGEDFPPSVTTARHRVPLHLYDWTDARYRVAACNSAGCARSTEVSVSLLRRDAVGYFKAAESMIGLGFGADTDLAANGLNFVSAAPGDLIASSSGPRAGGAIYVIRRSAGIWLQRARLVPTIPPFIEGSNVMKVAISADGNTVALGMPNYFHQEFDTRSGEVFVFRFSGGSWARTRIPAIARGGFGRWVGLSDAGDTLAIGRGDTVNGVPRRVDIYRLTNGTWTAVRSIGDMPGHNEFCDQGVLSADGSTVAESCEEGAVGTTPARVYVRTHTGTNWTRRADIPLEMSVTSEFGYGHGGIAIDGTGMTVAAQIFVANGPNPQDGPSEVHVFEREEDGIYEREAVLAPGAWRANDQRNFYGQSIALSGDGGLLAVGDPWDNGLGTGPRADPLNPGEARTGAVYVYRYRPYWYLYNMVKPNYHPTTAPYLTFGGDVALSHTGIALIVGESGESSDAEGISGSWSNLRAPGSGAVFLY